MAQTKTEILQLLAAADTQPRHRFGQNFMIDQNLVKLIADSGLVIPGQIVIEVGPGTGTLTDELLARGATVLAVEIDRDLAALLRSRYAIEPRFQLIEGDALAGKHAVHPELATAVTAATTAGNPVKLIANLPYNIASPLIIELLIAGVGLLSFTVQKEVADRLKAAAGSDDYGPLSVAAQMLGKIEVLRVLPPSAFYPPPKIDSALVRITRADRLGTRAAEFSRFVQAIFSSRRKTMRKALSLAGYPYSALATVGIDDNLRPETLAPEVFLRLFESCTG